MVSVHDSLDSDLSVASLAWGNPVGLTVLLKCDAEPEHGKQESTGPQNSRHWKDGRKKSSV